MLKTLAHFERVHLVFGIILNLFWQSLNLVWQILNLVWQILNLGWQFFIVVNGQ